VSFEPPAGSYKECPRVTGISGPGGVGGLPWFRREEGSGVAFYLDWSSCICVRTGALPPFPMLSLYPLPDGERRLTPVELAAETENSDKLVGPRLATVADMQAIEIATVTLGPTTHWESPGWRLVNHRFVFDVDGRAARRS
jgi:hypothetical protein